MEFRLRVQPPLAKLGTGNPNPCIFGFSAQHMRFGGKKLFDVGYFGGTPHARCQQQRVEPQVFGCFMLIGLESM